MSTTDQLKPIPPPLNYKRFYIHAFISSASHVAKMHAGTAHEKQRKCVISVSNCGSVVGSRWDGLRGLQIAGLLGFPHNGAKK